MAIAATHPALALLPCRCRSRPCRGGRLPAAARCSPVQAAPLPPAAVGRRRLLSAATVALACPCGACSSRWGGLMDRVFAEAMATGMADYELAVAPLKRRLFGELLGALGAQHAQQQGQQQQGALQVLELGIGTGPNLRYYSDAALTQQQQQRGGVPPPMPAAGGEGGRALPLAPCLQVVGVDPNPFMWPYLQQSAAAAGWPEEQLRWVAGTAEALPVPDASMDAVVCTLVLCSVPNPAAALAEVVRVLKPGGRFLFIEHTLAPPSAPLLRVGQVVINPLQQLLADGCHLTRDPLPAIQAAGFGAVEAMRLEIEGQALIAPHVAGLATAAGGNGGSISNGRLTGACDA